MASGSAAAAHFLKAPFILCNCTIQFRLTNISPFPLTFHAKKKKRQNKTKNPESVINLSLCIAYINTPCNCLSLLVLILCPLFFSFVLWLPQHYYSQPWNSSCKCRKHAHPFRTNWMACIKEARALHLLLLHTKSTHHMVHRKRQVLDSRLIIYELESTLWGLVEMSCIVVYYSICTLCACVYLYR